MSVTKAYFFAAICHCDLWLFVPMLWRMLKERQYEGSDGKIVKSDEHPAIFRLTVYLTVAIVMAIAWGAVWSLVVIARHWL